MTDNNDYLRTGDRTFRLRADVFMLMMKRAAYAALFTFGVGLFIWVFYLISLLLPDAAREADDPTPFSSIEIVAPEKTRV